MLYKAQETKVAKGYIVQCDDLVGTGRNWTEPAKILGMAQTDFLKFVINKKGKLTPYRKDGKISFVGYHWDNLADARAFKNLLNAQSRKQNYQI